MATGGGTTGQQQNAAGSDKQHKLYQLVDMHGGGELIKWMRYARKGGDYSIVDGYFETTIKQSMYNMGKGKLESVAELVKMRNKERNERLGAFSRKKGKGKSGPNILEDFNQDQNQGDLKKALKLLDGGKGGKGDTKYREIVWKIEERGTMGENLVGCCLMQGGPIHTELAIRLLNEFPKLVNDVMLSEDYYGLSPLHQAIVNEDPSLCNYLLQHGADVNQRCYGAFFCPEDQKGSRTDSLEHEYVELSQKTDYSGRMYFGEYPLAFAACTNQFDCYRLLRAKRADPNAQDTNGNACLHMTVIHEKMEMLKLVYDSGGRLQLLNKQGLTPLTLAANLAKKKMFHLILQLESEYLWDYGQASSVAYPLAKIDTINEETGDLNEKSALYLVVYGESQGHLEMLDGLLEDLLEVKWEAFAKRRWFMSLFGFFIFYIIFSLAFMCRPFSASTWVLTGGNISWTGQVVNNGSTTALMLLPQHNDPRNDSGPFGWFGNDYFDKPSCHLWKYQYGYQGYIRMVCEPLVLAIVLFQLISELFDISNIGHQRWWRILMSFPTKIFYKAALLLILGVFPIRFLCGLDDSMLFLDNCFSVLSVVLISVHFLYYCRAVNFVGPFVLMIYKIITQDLIRFFLIYIIFLIGFSQGFYIVFRSCERARLDNPQADSQDATDNILSSPFEALIRLFIMTTGEYQTFYSNLSTCQVPVMSVVGKILFFIYEVFVSLMQFNLLIAMMTRTYEMIYATEKEWKRQWAQVILMIELSISPKARLMSMLEYSRPIGTDKRKRAFVVSRKNEMASESEQLRKEQQANAVREEKKMILKRKLKDAMNREGRKSGMRPATSHLIPPGEQKMA